MNRKQRRSTASKERHAPVAQLPSAQMLPAMASELQRMGKAYSQTVQQINHQLGLLDSHNIVQYRVLNDIRKNEVAVDESGDLAIQWYHLLLGACISIANGMHALLVTPEEVEKPEGDLVALPDFGGDDEGA